jgi:hypothetical protein
MGKVARVVGGGATGVITAKLCYLLLDSLGGWLGSMMIGVVIKNTSK